jgi:integrase
MVESMSGISEENQAYREPAGHSVSNEETAVDPYSLFVLAIRSPVTRSKYLQRMRYFLDYLEIPKSDDSGSIISFENRINIFAHRARTDIIWFSNSIVKYLHGHKQRVERKEITGSTLRNFIKPIKLFCEQLDFDISWKKIIRGMPRGRSYASNRAPTLDELIKLTQYPDRRIKPIIYTMVSSGIRIGAFDYLNGET